MSKNETQSAEIDFIDKLGTHSDVGRKLGRPEMLKRYISATKRRALFDGICAEAVIVYATFSLMKVAK